MAKEKICGIYKIENNANGKIYIGQSKDIYSRFKSHKSELRRNKHGNHYLQSSWNKYGEDSFKFEEIELCLIEELDQLERKWINIYKSTSNIYGYNLENGGHLNKILSDETKKKISENHADVNGKNNPFYGKKHSKETIAKIHSGPNHLISVTGENNVATKLTNEQVLTIKDMLINGESTSEIALKFEVSRDVINNIKNNKTWNSVGDLINLSNDVNEQYKIRQRNKQINESTAKIIIDLLLQNMGNQEISEKLNIKRSIIEHIRYKNIWKHLTQDIEFPSVKYNRAKGSNHGNSKLNEDQVKLIKTRLINGWRICEISEEMDIHKDLICCIKTGKTWKHVSV